MEVQDTLAVFAEIGIALAGFSGVVAALSSRARSEWTTTDTMRLSLLLQISLATSFFCLLPLVFLSTNLEAPIVWRTVSTTWLVYMAVNLRFVGRRYANLGPHPSDVSRPLLIVMFSIAVLGVALQLANAIVLLAPWPYLAVLLGGLVAAGLFFVRLVRALWVSSKPAT